MRLTILCGSFLLLAVANGGVIQESSATTAKEAENVNSVPVNSEADAYSSDESSGEDYDQYNYPPGYPYQYYQYPPVNPMLYGQYPQYYNPQKESNKDSKQTPPNQGAPPQYPPQYPSQYPPQYPPQYPSQYPPQYPSYYPQAPPYQPQYPQYPPPASRYGPPNNQPGVKNPQADNDDNVSDDYCSKE